MKIYIDPGHGGDSIGASYNGRLEQDDCLKLSLKIEEYLLKQENVEVKLSRRTSVNPTITSRCTEANKWGADYFISVHRNAFSPNKASGAEVYVYSQVQQNGETYNKAKNILELVCAATGYTNRGTKMGAPSYSDYGVNRLTNMSSCLFEFGFIDNDKDNKIFDSYFDEMAEAVAQGLVEACGGTYAKGEEKFEVQSVQIGSFEKLSNAQTYISQAKDKGLPAELATLNGVYKVILGDAYTREEANSLLTAAKKAGFEVALVPFIPIVPGDIDGDGKVTAADSRLALRDSVELEALTKRQKIAADIDGDGQITAMDAREILRQSVGLN